MEFAAAALASVASTVGTVATTVGSTAASIGTALVGTGAGIGAPAIPGLLSSVGGAGSLAFSILSGAATIGSVMQAQRAGEQQGRAYDLQAADAEASTTVEELQGLERRTSIKASLLAALGERDVAAAASGVDLSFGTPSIARREAQDDTERALNVDQATEDFRKARLLERAANYRRLAVEARSGGLGKAAALALEGGAKLFRRG